MVLSLQIELLKLFLKIWFKKQKNEWKLNYGDGR